VSFAPVSVVSVIDTPKLISNVSASNVAEVNFAVGAVFANVVNVYVAFPS
jgi:hypothetical protein